MAFEELLSDLGFIIGAFIYISIIIGISMLLKELGKITGHTARKIVHLSAGFSVFIVPFLNQPFLSLLVGLPFLLITRVSGPENIGKQVFDLMAEKDEREIGYLSGPFSYALSVNILVIIFCLPGMTRFFYFPASSIMVMAISDTVASFVGRKMGKHEIDIKYTKTVRSIEGSIALFFSAFLLSLFGFTFFGTWFPTNEHSMTISWILILSFLLALDSTIIEVISPSNLDDLTVPITGCLLTFGLTLILFPASIGII
ncbi:MAG: hypothetical protein GY870_17265 [archaeon]|nr:hypothetical protein [archaeon]